MLTLALATGTLGAFPASSPRLVANVVEAPRLHAPSIADVADVTVPPVLLPVVPTPAMPVVPTLSLPSISVQGPVEERPAPFTSALPDQRAQVAIHTAMAQIGLPYVWGGNGPTNGDSGFDCSGLTTFSYAAAGVGLPRTAHTQYYAGPHVPPVTALQPGDLVFYGTSARVHHVGMYIGDGKMVNAPTFGKPVQVAFYRWTGDDYLGATRPAATGSTTGLLPYAPPAPVPPSQPQDFPAPVAPAPTAEPQATAPQPVAALSAAQASAAVVTPVATVPPTTVTVTVPPTPAVPTTTSPRAVAATSRSTTTTSSSATAPKATTPSKSTTPAATTSPPTPTSSRPSTSASSPASSVKVTTSTVDAPAARTSVPPPSRSARTPSSLHFPAGGTRRRR